MVQRPQRLHPLAIDGLRIPCRARGLRRSLRLGLRRLPRPEFTEQQFHVFRDNTVNALRQHQTDPVAQLRNWQSLQWDNLPDGHWGKKQSLQAKIDALLA